MRRPRQYCAGAALLFAAKLIQIQRVSVTVQLDAREEIELLQPACAGDTSRRRHTRPKRGFCSHRRQAPTDTSSPAASVAIKRPSPSRSTFFACPRPPAW